MVPKNPQNVTIYGRLSWPVWGHAEAVARNAKGKYPRPAEEVAPEFNLLVEQAQYDKLVNHVKTVFFPFVLERFKAGEAKNALDEKQIKRIVDLIDSGDLENQPPYVPMKPVPEKSQALAPEAVAMIKISGQRGLDIDLKAIVTSEDELNVPDPDQLAFPIVKPIGQTVHRMYGGCYVAATVNLYAFVSGKLPGFSASAGTAVFKADGDRFGGGVDIDEDEIFLD